MDEFDILPGDGLPRIDIAFDSYRRQIRELQAENQQLEVRLKESTKLLKGLLPVIPGYWLDSVERKIAANEAALGG